MSTNPKLFIASLPFATTEDELRAHFAPIGEVVSAHVPRDRETNRSKGIGFIEMASPELAAEAIARLHESSLGGRRIVVTESRPNERGPRPGGYRGGGDRGAYGGGDRGYGGGQGGYGGGNGGRRY